MALFVMADTHLSFATGKPMDIFGSRWTDHPKKIAENWKKLVSPEDTVVIPGDISWGMSLAEAEEDLRFLHLLPGRKILSKGNHDYWWQTSAKLRTFFAEKGFTSLEILYNNALSADGFRICGTRGWYSEAASPGSADYRKIVSPGGGQTSQESFLPGGGGGGNACFPAFSAGFRELRMQRAGGRAPRGRRAALLLRTHARTVRASPAHRIRGHPLHPRLRRLSLLRALPDPARRRGGGNAVNK